MAISFRCSCGKALNLDVKVAGKRVRCPVCARVILVPGGQTETQTSSADLQNDGNGSKVAGPSRVLIVWLATIIGVLTAAIACLVIFIVLPKYAGQPGQPSAKEPAPNAAMQVGGNNQSMIQDGKVEWEAKGQVPRIVLAQDLALVRVRITDVRLEKKDNATQLVPTIYGGLGGIKRNTLLATLRDAEGGTIGHVIAKHEVIPGGDSAQVRIDCTNTENVATIEINLAKRHFFMKGEGHHAEVTRVAISPNSQYAASVSTDRAVRIWHLASGKPIRIFEHALSNLTCMSFGEDEHSLILGNGASIQDARTGIVSLNLENPLSRWSVQTGKEIQRFSGHTSGVNCFRQSNDGRFCIAGSIHGQYDKDSRSIKSPAPIRVWEMSTGKQVSALLGHPGSVLSVDISPDNKLAVSSGTDNTIRLWDLRLGKEIQQLELPYGSMIAKVVRFSLDGTDVVALRTGPASGLELRRWSTVTRQPTGKALLELQGMVEAVAISADCRRALAITTHHLGPGGVDAVIGSFDTLTGVRIHEQRVGDFRYTSLAVSSVGDLAVVGYRQSYPNKYHIASWLIPHE